MTDKTCMPAPACPEYTLCGMAFDAQESGDCDEKITIGNAGDKVTCQACLNTITQCKAVKRNRIP